MERGDGYVFASHLTPKQHVAVANLVGKKCKVSCVLNGVPVEALWDTGAQVSIVSKSWLGEYLPALKSRNIAELLGEEAGLNLIGANGGPIPFDGWVEVQFQLTSGTQSSIPLTVPLLVARDDLEYPIIGYVIEEVIKSPDQMGEDSVESLGEIMSSAFSEVKQESATALVDLVQMTGVERLCVLRSGRNNLTVPRVQTVAVACVNCGLLEERTPVLFEPAQESAWPAELGLSEQLLSLPRGLPRKVNIEVHNPTRHDIILGRRTSLGSLHLVQSVTPLEVQRKDLPHPENRTSTEEDIVVSHECESQPVSQGQGVDPRSKETFNSARTPQVELGNLTEEQRQLAIIILQEEAESFAKDDEDVASIEGVQMNLTLSDPTPVQKTYTSVPRPLHTEVKHYIEDLLNRGWITKSQLS